MRYNSGWRPNPQQRMQPRYGDERRGIPPSQLYNFNNTRKAVKDCGILMQRLTKIHRTILSLHPQIKIMILNGNVTTSSAETRCTQYPHSDELNVLKWYQHLRRIPDVDVTRKEISQMDNSYGIVVNPFGESYPEKPTTSSRTPAFKLICDYIFNGGIFLSSGGLPFTYYWDVQTGSQVNANIVVPNVPTHILWNTHQGIPQFQVRTTSLLLNNLLQITFNVMTTMDETTPGRTGPTNVTLFQNSNDTAYWRCPLVNTNVNEFRSISPQRSSNAVPIVRAIRHGSEVWPVSFVKYGYGVLLHVGVDLISGNITESELALKVVEGVVSNYLVYLK